MLRISKGLLNVLVTKFYKIERKSVGEHVQFTLNRFHPPHPFIINFIKKNVLLQGAALSYIIDCHFHFSSILMTAIEGHNKWNYFYSYRSSDQACWLWSELISERQRWDPSNFKIENLELSQKSPKAEKEHKLIWKCFSPGYVSGAKPWWMKHLYFQRQQKNICALFLIF